MCWCLMSGSVQWTEITSLVDYTICGPQIKLVLDGPCWSVAAENLKKIPKILTDGWLSQHQLGFLFCLPWGRPCGNHAKRCMNEKTIQCLPNPSQHVTHLSSTVSQLFEPQVQKKRSFHVPQPTFLFPLGTPMGQSR